MIKFDISNVELVFVLEKTECGERVTVLYKKVGTQYQ